MEPSPRARLNEWAWEVADIGRYERDKLRRKRDLSRRRISRAIKLLAFCLPVLVFAVVAIKVSSADNFEIPLPSGISLETFDAISETDAADKLEEIKEKFPDGKYWNSMGGASADEPHYNVTDTPCDHAAYGDTYCNRYSGVTHELFPQYDYLTQCLAFSSMVSDLIFGEDAPVTVFRNYDELKTGDQIRLTSEHHSMIVTEKTDEQVIVGEVNLDGAHCQISWGRAITREELAAYGEGIEYISRYS